MASLPPPLGIPPPTAERLGPDLGSAAMTNTHASPQFAVAVSPSRDVIFEILSWLPAKSLCRCRCVSKEWHALISDRAFVAAHRSRAEPLLVAMSDRTLLLLDTDGTVVRAVEDGGVQRFLPGEGHWTLQASLGDLACISTGDGQSGTLVVDLATGETLLACFKPVGEVVAVVEMHYVCFGFGRAAQSGSLKVFRLRIPRWGVDTQTSEVLTLGDGAKWRQTKSPPTKLSIWYCNTSGVAVNGALHFLSEDKDVALAFDLDSEKWKVIHGPQGVKTATSVAELNGFLCMVQSVKLVVTIWLMSDYDKNIWIKVYTMPAVGFVLPLRVLRCGGNLLFYYDYDYTGKPLLQVYDPLLRRCTEVKTLTKLNGRVSLCSSNLDPRFCDQS